MTPLAKYRIVPLVVGLIVLLSTISQTKPVHDQLQTTTVSTLHHSLSLTSPLLANRNLQSPSQPNHHFLAPSHRVNTSSLVFKTLDHINLTPLHFFPPVHTLLFQIVSMATNNTFVKETLPNAIAFTYGKLKLEIVSQVALGWDTVHAIAFWINEWVLNGGLGFFEVVIKVVTGMWVWVRFGIPPYVYWWHREDSDVP